jgi:putative transposase
LPRVLAMSRPRRIPNYPYTGVQRYFMTACTRNRQEHFKDPATVEMVVSAFSATADEHDFAIIVYCVMPDHVHLLVDGKNDGAHLPPFMKSAKQRSGYLFRRTHSQRLWQEGYYEHVLRDEERTESVVLYIIENPVRKKLVADVMDYPHWGSTLFSRPELLWSIGLRRT